RPRPIPEPPPVIRIVLPVIFMTFPLCTHTKLDTNQWEVGTLVELIGLGRSPAMQTRCRKPGTARSRLTRCEHLIYLSARNATKPGRRAGELFKPYLGNAR